MLEYYYRVPQQIYELIDKLTQCWHLNNHAQYVNSEHSIQPLTDSSLNIIRKQNNLSKSEVNNESIGINNSSVSLLATTTISTNKSNLARLGILLAGKQAACNNNNVNNYDGSTFTLIDSTEDEADSNIGLFKQ
ncbi:unnamed protein product [Rotaria sp. Silwood1]|nr:unnamed protein product [Rotaria sp. Silwood1]CAF3451840.1 unnamed protein product [Rotaria sp. Silwood1]CAF3510892.1 unnamed protein product [Rotaria sp. Silwood1]CAF4672775.1 unnamed protein product [Rotaria sp. Silwood1]CAF5051718.1 unnamed protein product [Rotaria sp. Silwood1]